MNNNCQIANNGGRINKSNIRVGDENNTNNISKKSKFHFSWSSAGSGFIGGVIASIVATLVMKLFGWM